ncbi:hypothetical protein HDK64DRAFT_112439 [Phyllosticta capitalensis]|uniref:Uncharacterized protein n=1 Tax=Phyllosticta capitalensis TaxID=121624 RepID=A0ABR1YM59_9PEZI
MHGLVVPRVHLVVDGVYSVFGCRGHLCLGGTFICLLLPVSSRLTFLFLSTHDIPLFPQTNSRYRQAAGMQCPMYTLVIMISTGFFRR